MNFPNSFYGHFLTHLRGDFRVISGRFPGMLSAQFRGIPKVISGARFWKRFRESVRDDFRYFGSTIQDIFGYDTPRINSWKRYYREKKLPRNRTFEGRILSPEPKFVRKRRHSSVRKRRLSFSNTPAYDAVSVFENEIPEKS